MSLLMESSQHVIAYGEHAPPFSSTFSQKYLGGVWLEELKFNKHCSTFVLFDKKFPIWD
jgi:hypothetical protein